MKKLLVLLAVLAMVAVWTPAMAAPFLVCDCTPAVDKVTAFSLQFGTAAWIDVPAASVCGSTGPITCGTDQKTICYDLAVLPTGPFTVKARAKNLWGTSGDSLPFADTKGLPGISTSTRIVP